ncbi:hypothetical protein [Peribacillus sp. NPDC058075]|uniref:hypothetical protein n=1 Tax=unclassified Peribacillus TaxID=2675266 RepID=UPI0036D798DE
MEVNDLINVFVEQNKSYKEMLFWALTSIITILVIFLTANFFTMRKFREDEIEKIKTAVILDIKTNSLSELKEELNKSLTLSLEKQKMELKFKVDHIGENQITIKRDILEMRGLLYQLEGDLDFETEIYFNAFTSYLEAGNIFVEADTGGIDSILSKLQESAENLDDIYGSELSEFNRFASQLEPEYHTQANKIINILKSKKNS